jgi:hypothetical protein
MMEQQMGGMMGMPSGASKPPADIRVEVRGKKTVNGYACKQHELYEGKRKVAEVCMATAAAAKVSEADYATLMAMMDFMREMMKSASPMAGNEDPLTMSGLKGIPVAMKNLKNGDSHSLAAVSSKKLSEKQFSEYKAYRKQELPRP